MVCFSSDLVAYMYNLIGVGQKNKHQKMLVFLYFNVFKTVEHGNEVDGRNKEPPAMRVGKQEVIPKNSPI